MSGKKVTHIKWSQAYRNPLVFIGIGPGYFLAIAGRYLQEWEGKNERRRVVPPNLANLKSDTGKNKKALLANLHAMRAFR